jgi:3'(2'), 5'-bisphosphate nucleotidase
LGTKKWDTCAPEAIIKSVGGDMTDRFGKKFSYDRNVNVNNDDGVLSSLKDLPKYIQALSNL